MFFYVINSTISRTKNSWDSRVKNTHPLIQLQGHSNYPWILIYPEHLYLNILLGFQTHHVQSQIHHFLLKLSPPLSSSLGSQTISQLLVFRYSFVHHSHVLPHCQSRICQITNFLLPLSTSPDPSFYFIDRLSDLQ